MATTVVATGRSRLSPSEQEELHIRLATAYSLGDCNISTESAVSNILAGREDPVPLYTTTTEERDDEIRQRIFDNSQKVWDSIFTVIQNGNIEALDHFVQLGFDINAPHPRRQQFPIYHAVQYSQTNMMRHLINLHADVNVWSAPLAFDFPWATPLPNRARTPLMAAAEKGNLNICKILCESAFADPMLIAPDGQTAQRLAAKNGHKEIVQYLPAHRGGAWLRLKCTIPWCSMLMIDDYDHRWTFIRRSTKGIYLFFKVLLYEIPRFLFIDGPWELIKATSREAIRLYRAIPPVSEWPDIISRAVISMAKGIGRFLVALGKALKAIPKATYDTGKYIVKRTWKGIKAIPHLVKIGAEKLWSGVKIIGTWLKDLFSRFNSLH